VGRVSQTEELFGLTGEGSVVDLHLVGLEKDEIGGDEVTTLDLNDIAGHDFGSSNYASLAVTENLASLGDEVGEILHERGSLGGLSVGEDAGKEHDDGKDNTEVKVRLISLVLLDGEGDEAKEGSEPKEEGEETSLLLKEKDDLGSLLLVGELVRAFDLVKVGGSGGGETRVVAGLEFFLKTLSIPHVVLLYWHMTVRIIFERCGVILF